MWINGVKEERTRVISGIETLAKIATSIPMVEKCLLRILGISPGFLFISFLHGWIFDCRNHFVITPLAIDQSIYSLPGFFMFFMLLLKY